MSTIRNEIKREALSQSRQTRAKKRQADAKKYNRKANKTDEAIINGNIRQASALRAYGIKKQRAQGNQIYGFDEKDLYNSRSTQLTVGREKNKDKAEYLYTNKRSVVPAGVREDGTKYDSFVTKKRRLSDDEKNNFAKYGDTFDKDADKKKYKLFNSANKDADSYLEHFNTGQWDGLKTAKARIKDQNKKGISKLVEYGIGLGKDILADPVVDAMRVADAVGGAMTGAGLGALENMENALKGHKMEKGLIRKNFKDSLSTSNKTGWSKGSSEFLTEKDIRQFEKDRKYFKNDAMLEKIYGTSDLEEFKEKAQKGNNWAGLIWDVIGDPTGLVTNFGKNATKATVKAGKEMLDGTADISTAFKSKHLDDVFTSSDVLENKKIFDKSRSRKINSELDKSYDVKVNIKEKVSTNPQTPALASYLNKLDIDYKPVNDNVSMGVDISANKVAQDMKPNYNNYNFPSENFNTDYVRKPDPELKTGRYKHENGVQNNIKYDNELYDKVSEYERLIDESDDKVADLIYDYLEENEPEVYARLMDGADLVDEIVGAGKKQKIINDNYTRQYKEIENKAKKEKKLEKQFNRKKEEELREENAIEKLANIFERKNTKPTNAVTSKYEFSDNINNLTDKIVKSSEQAGEIKSIIKKLKGNSITNQTKREQINNLLFGGREIITNRVSSKAMDELLTSFDEIIEVKKAKDWYNETGEIINVKLSESTRKMLGVAKNKKINIESIDVEKLAKTLNNKSRGYTDTRYPEKLELLANVYKYKSKTEVEKRIDDIPKELKKLDKLPLSQETINAKTELSKELKTLKKKLEDRNLHWNKIRNLSEEDFDKYILENYPEIRKNLSIYKKQTQQKAIEGINNLDGYKDAIKNATDEVVNKLYGDKDKLKKYEDRYDKNYASKFRTQMQEKLDLKYVKLDENSIPKNAKKDYKTLTKTRGTKEAISNIKKLLSEELDLRLNGKTKEASILREDIKFYTNKMRKAGVDDFYWFDEMKKFKSNLIKQAQKSATPSNPLEKLGVTINGKTYGKDLTADELQFQFLRSQGAKTLDELFDLDLPDVARAGDNTGSEIGSMLRVNNTPKETPLTKFRPQSKLPDPKYKLTKDKDLINLETGETKPFFDRHTTQEEYNEKIHGGFKQKNIEEYERLQKYVDNPDKYGIYDVMNLMDSMNIKFDPNDAKSMDKALNKFFWIIEKKGIVPSSMKNAPQPSKSVKDMRNLPTNELKQLSDETKELVDNPMSLVENRALQDRNRDEIIDNARKMYEREDKESLFDRLFQQADTKEKMRGIKPLFEQVDEYANSSEGLKQYYTNLAKNDEVIKQLELANKGIDVNKATTNKTILDKMSKQMNKHQFDPKTKRNYEEVVRQAIERGEIDEKIAERLTPEMLEKVMNSDKSIFDIKFKSDKQIKAENQANMTRELHKKADDYVAKQDKDTFGIRKKPKKVKQTEDIKPKTKEELLNDELSIDSIGKDVEKDIKQHQKENRPVSFEKFKSWLNNDELMAYQKNDLYDVYKSWLNSYKKGLTVYNPGWHVQNYFQNKGQNYLALGMDAFKPQTNAKQIIKEIKGKPNKAKDVGNYSPKQIAKMAKEMGVIGGLGADVQQTRGIFPRLENQIDNTWWMKKLMENEQTARLHHFITQLENGKTPEKALKSVNDTLFDYSKANKVDKVISDFVDPFWTFHKNNATLMGKSAFSPNSGRLNKVRKFHENLDDTQEKEVKQNYGRLYGNKSFVDDVNGDTYNFLYKEGMMPDIANALPLSQEEVENKLNPILRLLAQQSRGEGNFGNILVEGDKAGWGEVTKDERVGEVIQELNPFMPGLVKTLVKNHNTQKKVEDDKISEDTAKKQVFYDWLNYITGFKGNYYREVK